MGAWYVVQDVSSSGFFEVLEKTLHAMRMEVFFTLSGFFAHLVLERRGAKAFLSDRARRLLVPFAVAAPLLVGADWLIRKWALAAGSMNPAYAGGDSLLFRPLHLWFLELAFLLSVVVWALAATGLVPALLRLTAFFPRFPETALLLSLATWGCLTWLGEANPAYSFVPDLATGLRFLPFFLFGFVLWGHRAELGRLKRCGWMAPVGVVLAAWVFSGPLQWEPTGRALSSLAAWLGALGFFGLALRLEEAPRPALRALVESSYWVYLVHHPLVMAGQVAMARLPVAAGFKYAVLVVGVWAVAFASFRLLVRGTWLGPWVGVSVRPAAPAGP
jgi:peptidoglycan/LPS O-acetylase OafA/YrhL